MKSLDNLLQDYKNALSRLSEAASEARTELEQDGCILRFEFTFELFWKLLRIYLEQEGFITNSPRSTLKQAYQMGLLSVETLFLSTPGDRNASSHNYSRIEAAVILERVITLYVKAFHSMMVYLQN